MKRRSHSRMRDLVSLSGWLFADLMLALAMLFFSTSIIAKPTPPPPPSPTPTPKPALELSQNRITISIDPYGILNDSPDAISNVETQIQGQQVLQNRSAGLVIVYGGAPGTAEIRTAQDIARKIYGILGQLGQQGFVFSHAVYYDPLYTLGGNMYEVTLDIYLFSGGEI